MRRSRCRFRSLLLRSRWRLSFDSSSEGPPCLRYGFADVYMIEADFKAKVQSEFDKMISSATKVAG